MRKNSQTFQRVTLHVDYFQQPPTTRIARAINYAFESLSPGCTTVITCADAPISDKLNPDLIELVVYALERAKDESEGARCSDFCGAVVPTTFVFKDPRGREAEAYAILFTARNSAGYEWLYVDFFPVGDVAIPKDAVAKIGVTTQEVLDQRKQGEEPEKTEVHRAARFLEILKNGLNSALITPSERHN